MSFEGLRTGSFLLGGLVLVLVWSRSRERPLSYFLGKRLRSRARLLSLGVLLLGALQLLGFDLRLFAFEAPILRIGGLILFWAGVFLASWGKITLGSNWDPEKDDRPLITRGAYNLSRHPIYLGGFLAALGAELSLQSLFVLLAVPGIFLLVRACVEEEAQLLVHFGEGYRRYQTKTRRFILF